MKASDRELTGAYGDDGRFAKTTVGGATMVVHVVVESAARGLPDASVIWESFAFSVRE